MQMTLEDRDKLLEALKNGGYPQGVHRLEQGGKFCCLGVFSLLFYSDVGLHRKQRSDGMFYYVDTEKRYASVVDLHPDFWGRFQCSGQGFSVPSNLLTNEELTLLDWLRIDETLVPAMSLNDGGIPFPRIAELAEKVIVVIDNYEDRNVVFNPHGAYGTAAAT